MDSNDNPQGGPAPASPSTEAEDAGSRREPGISRPLGSDSSFPPGSPPQPTAQETVATPRGAPVSRQFGAQPAEQATAGTRPAGAATPAQPATAVSRSASNPAAKYFGDGSGSPGSRPSERQPPPGPPGSDDADDGPDGDGKKKRTWKRWLLRIALLAIVIVATLLVLWQLTKDDGSDGDNVADQPEAEVPAVDFCRHGGPASLDEVGVPRFSDKLEGRARSFWSDEAAVEASAQAVLDDIVEDLFSTDGDGCTPPGAAYWRLVRPVSIDAGLLGVDDFDSATRIGIYEKDADTAMAVAVETASQLSDCADPQFVHLTAEEAPTIYVAAYAADYDNVVFVRIPLKEVDELPDGGRGLKVLRCSFGKVEGSDGDYVNDVLISPSLRAIIYLDSPAGVEVIDIVPDEGEGGDSHDLSDDEASETDLSDEPAGEDASEVEDTSSSEDDQAAEADDEASETDEMQPDSGAGDKQSTADEDEAKTSTDETSQADEPEDSKQAGEAETKTTTEEEEQPEGKATGVTEEESGQPEETKVTAEDGEGVDEKIGGEEQPEGGSGGGCDGTCGEGDPDPESEKGGKGSGDDCEDDCPGEGKGSGDDCEDGDCPGDGPGSGDDCEDGDCPGEGGGDDCQGDDCPGEGGDCEGDDCPGDGECEGDDCPDEEEVDKEPCPEGWLLDPFDNCKAPDPGPDGF